MYIIGLFRRTALWAMLLTILGSISMRSPDMLYMLVILGGAYLLFVLIHLLACKISKSSRSAGESYVSALGYDLAAPFSEIGTFIAVITKSGLSMMILNFITLSMVFKLLLEVFGPLLFGE